MKKSIALLLALVLIPALFAGCGGTSPGSVVAAGQPADNSGEIPQEPVVVEVFQAKVELKDALEELAEAYMNEHKNVTINVTTIGGGEDWAVALQSKFLSNSAPDIFVVTGAQDCQDWLSRLTDLGDTACVSNAYESAIADVTVDGVVYGVPFNMEGLGLVYNKRMFEAAGLKAEDITTWEDLVVATEKLDSMKDELGIEAVYAQNCKNYQALSNTAATIFLSPELKSAANTLATDSLEFAYGDQFKEFIDLLAAYGIQPSLNVDYSTQVEQYFCMERVAMIPQGNWIFSTVNGIDAELAQDIGILAVPVKGVGDPQLCVNVPYYWVINNESDNATIQAAKEFLDYMYTSDVGKDYVVNKFNFIPAYKGYEDYEISDPLSRDVYAYYSAGNTIPFIYSGYPAGWGSDFFASYLQKYLAGEMAWEDVIEQSKTSWTDARK